jgi:hypothetical protein
VQPRGTCRGGIGIGGGRGADRARARTLQVGDQLGVGCAMTTPHHIIAGRRGRRRVRARRRTRGEKRLPYFRYFSSSHAPLDPRAPAPVRPVRGSQTVDRRRRTNTLSGSASSFECQFNGNPVLGGRNAAPRTRKTPARPNSLSRKNEPTRTEFAEFSKSEKRISSDNPAHGAKNLTQIFTANLEPTLTTNATLARRSSLVTQPNTAASTCRTSLKSSLHQLLWKIRNHYTTKKGKATTQLRHRSN